MAWYAILIQCPNHHKSYFSKLFFLTILFYDNRIGICKPYGQPFQSYQASKISPPVEAKVIEILQNAFDKDIETDFDLVLAPRVKSLFYVFIVSVKVLQIIFIA